MCPAFVRGRGLAQKRPLHRSSPSARLRELRLLSCGRRYQHARPHHPHACASCDTPRRLSRPALRTNSPSARLRQLRPAIPRSPRSPETSPSARLRELRQWLCVKHPKCGSSPSARLRELRPPLPKPSYVEEISPHRANLLDDRPVAPAEARVWNAGGRLSPSARCAV